MARSVNTIIDSLNFFVESRNVGNIITVPTTATGSSNSGDLVNTDQLGGMFFVTFASVTVNTASVTFSILAKDVSASVYFPYVSQTLNVSSATLKSTILLYVGAVATTTYVDPSVTLINMPVPNVFQATVTVSIATTASMSGTVAYKVDYSKVM